MWALVVPVLEGLGLRSAASYLGGSAMLAGIWQMLRGAVVWAFGSLFGSLIMGLGLGTISYIGLKPLIDKTLSEAVSYITLGEPWISFLGVAQIDVCIKIWSSALLAKIAMMSLKKMVMR